MGKSKDRYVAEFDELHLLGSLLYESYMSGKVSKQEVVEQCENMFIHAYMLGLDKGLEDLQEDGELDSTDIAFYKDYLYTESMNAIQESVHKKTDGKAFANRIEEHLNNADGASSIEKVLVTEYHRNANEGVQQTGTLLQKLGVSKQFFKEWETMQDEKVRDLHDYLDGQIVPVGEDFYTYNGDHAPYPGTFGIAEEDINCRCIINLTSKGQRKQDGSSAE